MPYKRILTMQDISCVGQCSMTVALPILSACGHETCVLPAAVLSTHTGGFSTPVKLELTSVLSEIRQHWEREQIDFDAIYTGYLGGILQIEVAKDILSGMKADGGIAIVDPAMADHGKLYRGLDGGYMLAMKDLCARADIILPNITEGCMMTGMAYRVDYDKAYISSLLRKLSELGAKTILLTGVGFAPEKTGFALWTGGEVSYYQHEKIDSAYHGTGDIFAAAFVGSIMQGKGLMQAAVIASEYTAECIRRTCVDRKHWYGIKFEAALPNLIEMLDLK